MTGLIFLLQNGSYLIIFAKLLAQIMMFTLTVWGRQILTTEFDPRIVRVKIFIMTVDP